jgi:hypothetical protein
MSKTYSISARDTGTDARVYAITLEQLIALADFISFVDGYRMSKACSEAHQIVMAVLGGDEPLLYCPLQDPEEAA